MCLTFIDDCYRYEDDLSKGKTKNYLLQKLQNVVQFREELLSKLSMENSDTDNVLEKFLLICAGALEKLTPPKK